MPKKNKLNSDDVANILNNIDYGGFHRIAEQANVANKTVMDVCKAYPLWDYYRKPENYNYGDTNS